MSHEGISGRWWSRTTASSAVDEVIDTIIDKLESKYL
jgi:uncharacterized PurR-regulated membrane protein YhhQ (DUF165 family)